MVIHMLLCSVANRAAAAKVEHGASLASTDDIVMRTTIVLLHSPSVGMTGNASTTPNCSRFCVHVHCDIAKGPRPIAYAMTYAWQQSVQTQ